MTAVPLTLFTLAGIVWLLQSCTAIDMHTAPPPDWPKLDTRIHHVSLLEVQKKCGGNLLVQYAACADVRFDTKTCDIYYAADDEYGLMALEHEKEHCKGRDHIGSTYLRDLWVNWRTNLTASVSPKQRNIQ